MDENNDDDDSRTFFWKKKPTTGVCAVDSVLLHCVQITCTDDKISLGYYMEFMVEIVDVSA